MDIDRARAVYADGNKVNGQRLAAISGLAGPVLFVLAIVAIATQYPGYSHLRQAISELGGSDSPVRLWQSLNFVYLGVAISLFAFGWTASVGGRINATRALILYFAVAAGIGNGIFPCDPGCEFETAIGITHNVLGATGFIALAIGLLLSLRALRASAEWAGQARYTQITAVLLLLALPTWIIGGSIEPAVNGLLQRIMVFTFLQWFIVMSLHLYRRG